METLHWFYVGVLASIVAFLYLVGVVTDWLFYKPPEQRSDQPDRNGSDG